MDSIRSISTSSYNPFRSSTRRSKTDVFGCQYIRSLGREYSSLVSRNELGKTTVSQVLDFQDKLRASSCKINSPTAFKTMEQGSEVLLSYLLSEPNAKTQSKTYFRFRSPWAYPSFVRDGQKFSVRSTRGDGACALHALLGEKRSGTYVANNPRKQYTAGLKKALGQKKSDVQNSFVGAMTSALNATSDRHSLALFRGTNFKKEWNSFERKEKRYLNKIKKYETRFWKHRLEQIKTPLLDSIRAERARGYDKFPGKTDKEILNFYRLHPEKLYERVMEEPDTYSIYLQPKDQKRADEYRSLQKVVTNYFDQKKRAFILSKSFVSHYLQRVQKNSFYFDTQEIGIAALIFNKRVEMQSPRGEGETINPNATGGTVTIFHRGAHFSRCVAT